MSEKKKKNEEPPLRYVPNRFPCPICGERQFNWGHVIGDVGFRDSDSWFSHAKMYARECRTCGNVQFFTNRGTKYGLLRRRK